MTRTSSTGTSNRPPPGFSLVEMLVVLAIASLVVVLVLPRFYPGKAGPAPDDAAQAVSAFVHQSQARAMGNGKALEILVADDGRRLLWAFLPRPDPASPDPFTEGVRLPEQNRLALVLPAAKDNDEAFGGRLVISADGYAAPFSLRLGDAHGNEELLSFSPFLAVTGVPRASAP